VPKYTRFSDVSTDVLESCNSKLLKT
jgi:hypothetical protein